MIQSPPVAQVNRMPHDPFDTLGLPPRFDLDPGTIQRAYLTRTGALASDPQDESAAAALNKARIILEDPEQRAGALLARLGGSPKDAQRALPDGFLMEMMQVREQIDAEKADPSSLERWEAWGEARRREHIRAAGELFAQAEAAATAGTGVPGSLLGDLRRRLNAWRYIERMLQQLHGEEDPGAHR